MSEPFFIIRTRNGDEILVDREDFPFLTRFTWYLLGSVEKHPKYACTTIVIKGKRTHATMHAMVMGFPSQMIDHANGNGLDNRKANLRKCTHAQNMHNKLTRGPFYYKGVTFQKRGDGGRYQAKISLNKKRYYLGYFDTPEQAAQAYDLAAMKYHGEFARLNFPDRAKRLKGESK